jgi:predicted nucleic acid-binding protein
MSGGVTLDAGGLIAFERNDRRVVALLARAQELGAAVIVPATALAQVVRAPVRQVRLMRLLRQPRTATIALDRADASLVGQLLAATGTADVVDAHVVICARRAGYAVVTSDHDDLRRLDAEIPLIGV